jgi:transcriptional regulator with XRE-family HTH domain
MGANPVDEHFGARICMRRTMLRLSQRRLADVLGVSLAQMQEYENGTSQLSVSRLCAIAAILDVAPEFFFCRRATRAARSENQKAADDRVFGQLPRRHR